MPRKRAKDSGGQLSLFDAGMIAAPPAGREAVRVPASRTTYLPPAADSAAPSLAPATTMHSPSFNTASAFETAAYNHYMKLRGETYSLARVSGTLAVVLIAVDFLGVKVSGADVGPWKIGPIQPWHLVGLLGWLTFLAASLTLVWFTYATQKKVDCGLFYQRVMRFSGHPFLDLLTRGLGVLFVLVFSAIAALPWVAVSAEMTWFVELILRGIFFLFDPWRPTVKPSFS